MHNGSYGNESIRVGGSVTQMIRGMLLGASFALLVIVTASVHGQSKDETGMEIRLRDLERAQVPLEAQTQNHEVRLVKLEDAVAAFKESSDEERWWLRGIGGALSLAVLERVLRTAGVLRKGRSDGMGPVG